jgi:hypothetical protein
VRRVNIHQLADERKISGPQANCLGNFGPPHQVISWEVRVGSFHLINLPLQFVSLHL